MRFFLLLGTLALAACSSEFIIDAAYPDRARFQFLSEDQDQILYWACDNGPTVEETENRAKSAHVFMEAQIAAYAEQQIAQMAERLDAG